MSKYREKIGVVLGIVILGQGLVGGCGSGSTHPTNQVLPPPPVITTTTAPITSSQPSPTTTQPPPATSQTPITTQPLPKTTQGPSDATGWIADGIISPTDGYTGNRQFSDKFTIYWKVSGSYLYVAIQAKTAGWVALAFSPTQTKEVADLFIGYVQNGQTTMLNCYGISFESGKHTPKVNSELTAFGGSFIDGTTTIEFKRPIAVGNAKDVAIINGNNNILWAIGATAEFIEHTAAGLAVIPITW